MKKTSSLVRTSTAAPQSLTRGRATSLRIFKQSARQVAEMRETMELPKQLILRCSAHAGATALLAIPGLQDAMAMFAEARSSGASYEVDMEPQNISFFRETESLFKGLEMKFNLDPPDARRWAIYFGVEALHSLGIRFLLSEIEKAVLKRALATK